MAITGEFYNVAVTNVSNVNAGASSGLAQYISINDDIISYGGFIYVVPASSQTQFLFRASLPVAVTFTNGSQLSGMAMCADTVTANVGNAFVAANITSDLMSVQINFSSATANPINMQFNVLYEAVYSGV